MSSSNKLSSTATPLFGLKSKFTFNIQYIKGNIYTKRNEIQLFHFFFVYLLLLLKESKKKKKIWNYGPNGLHIVRIVSCYVYITIQCFNQILISFTGLVTLGPSIMVLAANGFQSILHHNFLAPVDEIKIWLKRCGQCFFLQHMPSIFKIIGSVAVLWHFEFYILKCMTF